MNVFDLFRAKHKAPSPSSSPALPPGVRQADAAALLRGVPRLNPHVERVSDRRYGCLLAWPVAEPEDQRRRGWLPRWHAKTAPRRRRRLVLDDLGRRTVELIDGRRTLAEIAAVLAHESGHDAAAMEQAVLAFIGQLVRRRAAALTAARER